MSKNDTIVVNLFGAPGSGKSTLAAYIYSKLKMFGMEVELVTEFAKDKVWDDNPEALGYQAYIFGEQSYRMDRLKSKVDVIVTDSPLPLSIIYNSDPRLGDSFNKVVLDVYNSYINLNYFINNEGKYNNKGRIHSEDEAKELADNIKTMLDSNRVPCESISGTPEDKYKRILYDILSVKLSK